MSDDVFMEIFEIKQETNFEFKTIYGFTFVFKTKITTISDRLPSGEIKPIAIIYKDKEDYYLAPLDVVENIEEVVREYVKNIKEEEYTRF